MTWHTLRDRALRRVRSATSPARCARATGLTAWVDGLEAAVGDLVDLEVGGRLLPAEVVGADATG